MVCSCTSMNFHTCQIWWWKQPSGFTLPTLHIDLLLSLFLLFSSEATGKDLSKQSSYRCPSVAGHPTVLCLFSWFCYCMNSCALENEAPSFTWSTDDGFGNKEWSHPSPFLLFLWDLGAGFQLLEKYIPVSLGVKSHFWYIVTLKVSYRDKSHHELWPDSQKCRREKTGFRGSGDNS